MANIITDTSITEITTAHDITADNANAPHIDLENMMVEIQAHHNGALTHDGNLNIVGNLQENGVEIANISSIETITNKTINANNNTISNLEHGAEVDNPTVAHGATGAVVGTTNTQTLTNKSLGSGFNFSLGSDADGDIYYRNSGVLTRVAKEYDDDELIMINSIPTWQRPKWTYALQLGNELNIAGIGVLALTALNENDIAFIDNTNDDLRTSRFSDNTWSQVGSDLNITGVNSPALAALNSTDVVFIDSLNDDLRTYRFNGSTWSQVGSDLNITPSVGSPALAALNSTDVAFIDSLNDDLRTYRFNGSTWSQVGSDLNIINNGVPAITALNSTDVAFIDTWNKDLRTYRFNGSTWSQVGSDLNISTIGPAIALTALNETDIVFIDNTNDDLRIYRFNGSTWSQVGNDLNISGVGSPPALAALNSTDVAFIDSGNEDLRTYRWL